MARKDEIQRGEVGGTGNGDTKSELKLSRNGQIDKIINAAREDSIGHRKRKPATPYETLKKQIKTFRRKWAQDPIVDGEEKKAIINELRELIEELSSWQDPVANEPEKEAEEQMATEENGIGQEQMEQMDATENITATEA